MSILLKDIFGDTSRVRILEELVENWGEYLSVAELSRMSDVTKKTVYKHLYLLEDIGMVESRERKAVQYRLRTKDERCLALAILESEEYLRKLKIAALKEGIVLGDEEGESEFKMPAKVRME
jgi:DNA-binding transcriptional ArsR family regulator